MVPYGISGGILECVLSSNIYPNARIELQSFSARRGFRVAKHDPNFLAILFGEEQGGFCFVETQVVFSFARPPVKFLNAWLIGRACIPIVAMPISPSNSAFGTSAATES